MATAAELKAFADKTNFEIPTIDYQVGVLSGTVLKSFTSLIGTPGVTYDAVSKFLHIKADGIKLVGYNFSGITVSVAANNVTIQNSKFDASFGAYSVMQIKGKAGLVLDQNTFDGLKLDRTFASFVHGGDGYLTLTKNVFLDSPSDAVQIKQGLIDHNYFKNAGYQTGAHADAINIDGMTGKITITNNFVDSRKGPDAIVEPTSALAIGNFFGNNQEIVATKNVFLGGAYTIYAQDYGKYDYTANVQIQDNFVGGGLFGDLYPNRRPAELVYASNGVSAPDIIPAPVKPKAGLVVAGSGQLANEVLRGTSDNDWLYGNGDGDQLIGGGGRDYLFGGKGKDVFVFEKASDSAVGMSDLVNNFEAGVDKIDLKGLATVAAPLKFISEAAFSGKAGEVNILKKDGSTWVQVDTNGDKTADLRVELKGDLKLAATDFIVSPPGAVALPPPVLPPVQPPAVEPILPAASVQLKGKLGVAETLQGSNMSDWLYGNGDGDRLVGNGGRDYLFGAKGKDVFVFNKATDSAPNAADVMGGFEAGIDKMDLKGMSTAAAPLRFLGEAAFDGAAGGVNVVKQGGSTWVQADLNGDKVADFRVEIKGTISLSAIDFIL
jgi:Ca2+-binding RTX toxin-like protein